MSLQFSCHQCGKKLGVDEALAGKRVRCPNCQAILAVPAQEPVPVAVLAPSPAPVLSAAMPLAPVTAPLAPAPQVAPRSVATATPDGPSLDAWTKVYDGLSNWLLGNRIVIAMVTIQLLAGFVFGFLALTMDHPEDLKGIPLVVTLALLIPMLIGTIIMAMGWVRCCAVPAESGAKGLIIAANLLGLIGYLLAILEVLNRALPMRDMPGLISQSLHIFLRNWLIVFWLGCLVSAAVCFMLFLRRTAYHLGNTALARRFSWFMLFWLAGPVLMVLYPVLFFGFIRVTGITPNAVLQFVFIITYLTGAILFLWMFFLWMWPLVGQVRDTVGQTVQRELASRSSAAASREELSDTASAAAAMPRNAGRNRVILYIVGLLLLIPGLAWPMAALVSYLPAREHFQSRIEDDTVRKLVHAEEARVLEEQAQRLGPDQRDLAFQLRDEARLKRRSESETVWNTSEPRRFFRTYEGLVIALFIGAPLVLLGLLLLVVTFFSARVRLGLLLGAILGVVGGALTCLVLDGLPYVQFERSYRPYRLSETLLFAPAAGLTLGLFAGLFYGWLNQQLCLPRAPRRWARPGITA